MGKAKLEENQILWTIGQLERERIAIMKFKADIQVETLDPVKTGTIEVNYKAECDHTAYYCQVAFDPAVYNNASDAWDHGQLGSFFGVRFDDTNTGFNAMNLIASILFFQMPEIHVAINLLIAVPIWIAIGYIALILILRAIDALPFT